MRTGDKQQLVFRVKQNLHHARGYLTNVEPERSATVKKVLREGQYLSVPYDKIVSVVQGMKESQEIFLLMWCQLVNFQHKRIIYKRDRIFRVKKFLQGNA